MSLQTRLADLIAALGADEKRRHGVSSVANAVTLSPTALVSQFNVTAQNGPLAIGAPPAGLLDGQSLLIRIKDNGTARAISWDAGYRAVGVTLPLTTVISKTLYIGAKWNAADSKYDVIAVGQEA
jgi:hypothetical protein